MHNFGVLTRALALGNAQTEVVWKIKLNTDY